MPGIYFASVKSETVFGAGTAIEVGVSPSDFTPDVSIDAVVTEW